MSARGAYTEACREITILYRNGCICICPTDETTAICCIFAADNSSRKCTVFQIKHIVCHADQTTVSSVPIRSRIYGHAADYLLYRSIAVALSDKPRGILSGCFNCTLNDKILNLSSVCIREKCNTRASGQCHGNRITASIESAGIHIRRSTDHGKAERGFADVDIGGHNGICARISTIDIFCKPFQIAFIGNQKSTVSIHSRLLA